MALLSDLRLRNRLGTCSPDGIFAAYDSRFARQVALRHLRPSPSPDHRARLRLLSSFRHPAFVQIYDLVPLEDSLLLVTEYVTGRNLAGMIADGPLDLALTLNLGRELAEGLQALHARELVHGDLKADNILVTPSGGIKVLLGSSAVASGHPTSPEQVRGDRVDHRADLFAFGAVLYEMVTGISPFEDLMPAKVLDKIASLRQQPAEEIDPRVPAQLSVLIDSLLAKRPAERPRSAAEVEAVLGEIAGSSRSWRGDSARFLPEAHRALGEPSRSLAMAGRPERGAVGGSLNPKYRFEDFVVSSSSQFVHAAARAVAQSPGESYNPLFIYGDVGLGKTHLLHAIGLSILAQRPQLRVAYVSSEQFINELISAIRFDRMPAFRDFYRTVDVLMIDDVQFLANKERTQEEFFHTFDALYAGRKQIVLTSDSSPRQIPVLEERLRSRFEWGLIADIQPPDLETKVAILQRKADVEGAALSYDIASFIARRTGPNIRELEGSLTRVLALSSLLDKPLSLELARKALEGFLPEPLDEPASDEPSIDQLYAELHQLSARGEAGEAGLEPEIASRLERLRKLQREEAQRMRERLESRLNLAPGAGHSALQKARQLLERHETAAPADPPRTLAD
jgi:chromosomal replication initiator protein DnaA